MSVAPREALGSGAPIAHFPTEGSKIQTNNSSLVPPSSSFSPFPNSFSPSPCCGVRRGVNSSSCLYSVFCSTYMFDVGRLCSSNSYDVEVSVRKHSLSHISQRQTLSTSLFSAFSTTSPHMIVCTAHITSLSAVTCFFLLKRGMKINKRKVCTSITIAIASQILMYQVQKQ